MSIYNKISKRSLRTRIIHFREIYWHYRKTPNILYKEDAIVTRLLAKGSTLCWNSFGERFVPHIPNLTVYDSFYKTNVDLNNHSFDNIVVLNAPQMRYIDVKEIFDNISPLIKLLNPNGKLVVGFNSQFLLWNRVSTNLEKQVDKFVDLFSQTDLQLQAKTVKLLQTSMTGDCKFIFTKTKGNKNG